MNLAVLYKIFSLVLFVQILFNSFSLIAQNDSSKIKDSIVLKQVDVLFQPEVSIDKINERNKQISKYSRENNSLLLEDNLYLKEYTLGGISSISVRGTNPSHTKILFDGFQLNSSLHGQLDLSLLPAFFFSNANWDIYNTDNPNSALGGTLNFSSNSPTNKKNSYSIYTKAGSFNSFEIGSKLNFNLLRNVKYQLSINYANAENNYPFVYEGVKYFTKNATFKRFNVLQTLDWKIKKHHSFKIHIWNNHLNRGIPNVASAINSPIKNKQTDWGNRVFLKYKFQKSRINFQVNSSVSKERIDYNDLISDLSSNLNSVSSFYIWDNFKLGLHFYINNYKAESHAFDKDKNRTSLLSSINAHYYLRERHQFKVNFQKEYVSDLDWQKLGSNFLYRFSLSDHLQINVNYSNAYRYPNLNDLYWNPGGNRNLLAEETNNFAIDLEKNISKTNSSYLFKGGVYHSTIKDYIQWTPDSEGIWSPTNLEKVSNTGFEASIKHFFSLNKIHFRQSLKYDFSKSVNNSRGDKQLIYVPLHQAAANHSILYKKIQFNIQNKIVGKRVITSDNSMYLTPYWISNVNLTYQFLFNKNTMDFGLDLKNIFNQHYQTIAQRPMPGFHFDITVKYTFNE